MWLLHCSGKSESYISQQCLVQTEYTKFRRNLLSGSPEICWVGLDTDGQVPGSRWPLVVGLRSNVTGLTAPVSSHVWAWESSFGVVAWFKEMSRKATDPLPTGLSAWLVEEPTVCLPERSCSRGQGEYDITALCTHPQTKWNEGKMKCRMESQGDRKSQRKKGQ